MVEVGYASASAIIADALKILLPPVRRTVPEHAAEHRWLKSKSGGGLERWSNDTAPYLSEPAECLTSEDYLTVAVIGPGQCGKTTIGENWLLHSVDTDPGDLLWYMQTESGIEGYVKDRINTLISTHEILRDSLGKKSVDDSLGFKKFDHMSVSFLSATENNLINKTARRIIADEVDAYPESLGDVMPILDVRRQTYGRHSKIFALSHPDQAQGLDPVKDWSKGIMAIYGDSDRRVWWCACPQCKAYSSFTPTATRVYTLNYPADGTLDEIEAAAHLVCPVNGCIIDDRQRVAMQVTGKWIGDGQEIAQDGTVTGELVRRKTAGFWIVGLMSPFILGTDRGLGLGSLARAKVKAERERDVSGEDMSLRTVMVKQFGVPYAPQRNFGTVDANELAERAESELKLGEVPEGVRFLTAAVDIQLAYFEYLVRGWGVRGESWIIDRGRILAEPSTSPDDWDKLFSELFRRSYPLADGSGRMMALRGAGFDSGGAPGVTQQAYAAWMRWKRLGLLRLYGKIGGQDAWSVVTTKGASSLNAPRLTVTYPDTARASNKLAAKGSVPVAAFNPNMFKDDLAGQLMRADDGPLRVHFPLALRSREKPHVWFEQMVAERPGKNGRWEKVSPSARNESLDLMVMTDVVARLHGLTRINWDKPPSWAQTWDKNTFVCDPNTTTETTTKKSIASRLA